MIGHKTNGDWSDVTSIGRNDIVFEGRHKDYGAYYIRKRYNFTLLLGFLFSISFLVIAGGLPLLMNLFHKEVIPGDAENHLIITTRTIDYTNPPKPPKPKPSTNTTPVKPPSNPNTTDASKNTVPDVKKDPIQKPDSDLTNKNKNDKNFGEKGPGNPDPGPTQLPGPGIGTGPGTGDGPKVPDAIDWAAVMPKFHGDLYDYLGKKIQYPELMTETGTEGTVYASFIIETDGSISNVTIVRGVPGGQALDKEAVRVLEAMPKWDPGSQGGKPVRVRYKIPIHFQLNH